MNVKAFKKRKDFDQLWIELVGSAPPTMQDISEILEDSILIQHGSQFVDRQRHLRIIPAMYWNPKRELVFQIDQYRKKVVKIFTPKLQKRKLGRA